MTNKEKLIYFLSEMEIILADLGGEKIKDESSDIHTFPRPIYRFNTKYGLFRVEVESPIKLSTESRIDWKNHYLTVFGRFEEWEENGAKKAGYHWKHNKHYGKLKEVDKNYIDEAVTDYFHMISNLCAKSLTI